jgi:hypothetical protein
MPSMDILSRDRFQLWQPLLYINTLRVVLSLLCPRIENPKIWLSVRSIADRPLPPSRILHGTIVHHSRGKIPLTLMPVQKKIFDQKRRNDHSASIVHESSCVHLPDRSVYYRKTGLTIFPGLHMMVVVFPLDLIEF